MDARAALSAFLGGLVRPSFASVIGAIAFALLELGACLCFVDERAMARLPSDFFKQDEADDRARITVDACRAHFRASPGVQVFYLGPSTARLALRDADHPEPIERALSEAVGDPVHFWNFTANGETVEEYLVIAEQLPADARGVLVVPFSDTRHDHVEHVDGARKRRTHELLGLDVTGLGPLAASIGEAPTHTTGVFFLDHLGFFAARRDALARLRPPPRVPAELHKHGATGRFAGIAKRMNDDSSTRALLERHVRLMRQVAKEADKRGLELVILEAPVAPAFNEGKPGLRAAYDEKVAELAYATNATYWDLNDEAKLTTEDFYDPVHIGEDDARRRYEAALVEHLAALIKSMP
ncbi:MAG TPA: hypothetical protein VGM56_20745 [Byssovorax sp.]